jgi:hypothetical protein
MKLSPASALDLLTSPREPRYFLAVSLRGCLPCKAFADDIAGGALEDLDLAFYTTETALETQVDEDLCAAIKATDFPYLVLIDGKKVARRWGGYFQMEPEARFQALRTLVTDAWHTTPSTQQESAS